MPQDIELLKQLQVLSLPTIEFWDGKGNHVPNARVTGFYAGSGYIPQNTFTKTTSYNDDIRLNTSTNESRTALGTRNGGAALLIQVTLSYSGDKSPIWFRLFMHRYYCPHTQSDDNKCAKLLSMNVLDSDPYHVIADDHPLFRNALFQSVRPWLSNGAEPVTSKTQFISMPY